jgi:dephospho-CoA kinase
MRPVAVVAYRPEWVREFDRVAARLHTVVGGFAVAIDHVGSTAVPGLPAKDCVDVQVRLRTIDEARDVPLLAGIGFRCRPEPWVPDLFEYGRIKATATQVLMVGAERWAAETGWRGAL